ncbi:MAG: SDR family NAD(P)-dependent oxidoreductase [Nevskia sp.]|nr:SDR family NAD(P)-dependent oxidoreductase [Nevskia sp.]
MSKSDNTVVITGATSGIGLGLVEAFLKEGYNVVGTGRSTERLRAVAARLNAGDRFLGVAGDVGKPESARKTFEQAIAKYGKVNVLVNNAGVFTAKPFVQFTPAEVEEQIATNLKGTLYPSQEAARHMSERKRGKIINITASLAIQPHGGVPALLAVALKGGINQATRALALELAPQGVTVNAVAPGVVDTPMHTPESHAALGALHPLGHIARIADITDAVLYLAKSDYVTGTVLPVDGGFSAGR